MCLGSTITWTSTPVGTSTQPAGSFCLCCFSQVVRHLWSLHVSGTPNHMDLHPGRNVYSTSHFILSVLFLTGGDTSVVPTWLWDLLSHDLTSSRNIYLTSWVILSVLFFTGVGCLWSLHVSGIPHHPDLHPSSNVYPTSWFILSVLFLTGSGTSVVPTCVWDPLLHAPPPW